MLVENYRGYNKQQKRWIRDGRLFETPLTEEAAGAKPEDGLFFLTGHKRTCIAKDGAVWEVKPETVGMGSGFIDTDNNEIYTDDVIQLEREDQPPLLFICRFGDVEFQIGDADVTARGFYFELVENGMKCYIHDIERATLKIIGNTFDNPELITKLILT